MYKRLIIISVALIISVVSYAQNGDSKEKGKSESRYSRLFKDKKVNSSKGLMDLHVVDGKIYIELPLELIGKDFLMSSVVDNVSDMGLSYIGQRTSRPMHITFSKSDSLVFINSVSRPVIVDKEDSNIQAAIDLSSKAPIINSSPILAFNGDSTTIVFDATSFFISGGRHIGTLNASSFGGFIQKVSTFSKELSGNNRVEAYENNISVINNMTYTFKTFFLGMESGAQEYLTVELRTNIMLLPQEIGKQRFADYRIGVDVTEFERFNSKKQGSFVEYFANRWSVDGQNPIIFYVDTLFAPNWREAIKRGATKWNSAFEAIGYKNVIQVKDYPSVQEDPNFSQSNIAYNCIRYAQNPSRSISRQINVDPRSGEILSASILVFRDAPIMLQRERLYTTAAVEPEVRGYMLPDKLMESALEMAITREMGFCLGLKANMAGSSWMDVDSLRSASFTKREGITSSVMDQVRYNYIAQPEDIKNGVVLCADKLGVYDYYVIDWLYSNADQKSLKQKIENKIDNPRYFYGKEQHWSAFFDPRSMADDLGNDPVKSAKYGINTLKYIAQNSTQWVNKDHVDLSYRELFVDFIFLKLYDYYRNIMVNIGGMNINQRYEGDDVNSYIPIDKNKQRESLLFMLEFAEQMDWLDNKELLMMSGMNASLSKYFANNLVRMPFQRVPMVEFTQTKSEDPYSLDMMLNDFSDFAFKNISRGEKPTEAQNAVLYNLVQLLLNRADLPKVAEAAKIKKANSFAGGSGVDGFGGFGGFGFGSFGGFGGEEDYFSYRNVRARCYPDTAFEPISGDFSDYDAGDLLGGFSEIRMGDRASYETMTSLRFLVPLNNRHTYFLHLEKLQDNLKKAQRRVKDSKTKDNLKYLLNVIEKGI